MSLTFFEDWWGVIHPHTGGIACPAIGLTAARRAFQGAFPDQGWVDLDEMVALDSDLAQAVMKGKPRDAAFAWYIDDMCVARPGFPLYERKQIATGRVIASIQDRYLMREMMSRGFAVRRARKPNYW